MKVEKIITNVGYVDYDLALQVGGVLIQLALASDSDKLSTVRVNCDMIRFDKFEDLTCPAACGLYCNAITFYILGRGIAKRDGDPVICGKLAEIQPYLQGLNIPK